MPREETFAAFMQRALFDPSSGYYSRQIKTVGARGDFSTSATVSPLLGRAIAAWLIEQSRTMPEVRTIIEVGGGDGSLMSAVRKHMGWWNRRRFQFCVVETSPVLEKQQRERLGDSIRWFRDLKDVLNAVDGRAFIFHNELLDALPITLVQWDADSAAWREVWLVHHEDGSVAEELRPLAHDSTARASSFSVLDHWTATSPPRSKRQRCELHTGIAGWLADWCPLWKTGAMLAIDYGDTFPNVYFRRPHGTLRAYLLHQRLEGADVYANAGRQDITCDINFTDVQNWCAQLGMSGLRIDAQVGFIKRMVPVSLAASTHGERFIMDEAGAGGAFKCLTAQMRR